MASANDIFKAIRAVWSASASLANYHGPYFDRAPQGTALPYVVFNSIANVREQNTCHGEIWLHGFQFVCRHRTAELAAAVLEAVGAVYDAAHPLTLATGAELHITREREIYREEDKNIFAASIEYRVLRYKPRGDV